MKAILHNIHPQYITNVKGKKLSVVLPMKEFENILEELEELEDIRLYDEAIKNDNGVRVSMNDAFAKIEAKRKK